MSLPETIEARAAAPETIPTLDRDGFEVVDIPINGPWLLPDGALRTDLRPSTNIKGNWLFLVHDPKRAEVWKGTITDPATKEQQDSLFSEKGYTKFETQFPRHIVAARTKLQTPKPTSASQKLD